jgi:hypothetical protein
MEPCSSRPECAWTRPRGGRAMAVPAIARSSGCGWQRARLRSDDRPVRDLRALPDQLQCERNLPEEWRPLGLERPEVGAGWAEQQVAAGVPPVRLGLAIHEGDERRPRRAHGLAPELEPLIGGDHALVEIDRTRPALVVAQRLQRAAGRILQRRLDGSILPVACGPVSRTADPRCPRGRPTLPARPRAPPGHGFYAAQSPHPSPVHVTATQAPR